MMTECADELAHPVRGESFALDMGGKRLGARKLPRPLKRLLAIARDARRGAVDCDGQFVPRRRELRLLRGGPYAPDDIGKIGIADGEIDRPFGLDVEERFRAVGIDGFDRDVIERAAVRRLLEPHHPGDGAGKTTRLAARQQVEQIERADLAFKQGAGRTGSGRRNGGREIGITLAHSA